VITNVKILNRNVLLRRGPTHCASVYASWQKEIDYRINFVMTLLNIFYFLIDEYNICNQLQHDSFESVNLQCDKGHFYDDQIEAVLLSLNFENDNRPIIICVLFPLRSCRR
jgi:hypothetical protein